MNGKILGMIGLLAVLANPARGDEFSTLEERMNGAEFRASGLQKLSREELRFLNEWLKNEGQAPVVAPPAQTATEAQESGVTEEQMGLRARGQPDDRVVIESTIDGEFSGWSGRTRFKLTNGQIWEQIGGGSYYASLDKPAVRIEPKMLGSWKLYVDGVGRSVKVRRIR